MCSKLDTFLDVFDFNLKKPPARPTQWMRPIPDCQICQLPMNWTARCQISDVIQWLCTWTMLAHFTKLDILLGVFDFNLKKPPARPTQWMRPIPDCQICQLPMNWTARCQNSEVIQCLCTWTLEWSAQHCTWPDIAVDIWHSDLFVRPPGLRSTWTCAQLV